MTQPESQILTAADVGKIDLTKQDPALAEAPETVLEYVQRITHNVKNTREWAKVKLATIEDRLEKSGGEAKADLKAAIAALKKEIGGA